MIKAKTEVFQGDRDGPARAARHRAQSALCDDLGMFVSLNVFVTHDEMPVLLLAPL